MYFVPIINRRGIGGTAEALGLPTKNVRRWVDMDSIPADWWGPLSRAAIATLDELAEAAERRRAPPADQPGASA